MKLGSYRPARSSASGLFGGGFPGCFAPPQIGPQGRHQPGVARLRLSGRGLLGGLRRYVGPGGRPIIGLGHRPALFSHPRASSPDFASLPRQLSLTRARPKRDRRRSSVVERIIGNAEVGSSILPGGTSIGYSGRAGRGPRRVFRQHQFWISQAPAGARAALRSLGRHVAHCGRRLPGRPVRSRSEGASRG